MYNDPIPFKLPRRLEHEGAVNIETITANKTLLDSDSQYQIITNNRGSTADIKLPSKVDGAWYWLKNSSSSPHAFVIQDSEGNPVIGGSGLAAGKAALVVCDGSNWAVVFQQS